MAELEITVEDNSAEVLAAIANALQRAGESIGATAEKHAKDNLTTQGAVDTGNLRNSIAYTVKNTADGCEITIGTDVNYGPYIEFGTGKYASTGGGTTKDSWIYFDDFGQAHKAFPQKPRPFLQPAVDEHQEEYKKKLTESLENA